MTKRANGEGTIFKRNDGRWSGDVSMGRDKSGKRRRVTVYGQTQSEVREKVDLLKQQAKLNRKAIVDKDSLAAYLDRWLEDDVKALKAAKTYEEYESAVRLYVRPHIGHIKLAKLNLGDLKTWQTKLLKEKKTDNQRLRAIRVLRNALNEAVREELIGQNPASKLKKPTVERKEMEVLEPSQCHDLFEEAAKHRIGDIITVAAMTGLRKRELFALEWSDVKLNEGFLTVRRTLDETNQGITVKAPKTKKSRRMVTLEPIAVAAFERRLRKAQDEGFGPEEVPVCFPNTMGGYLRSSNFDRKVWYPIREAAGIPSSIKFHDLRHTQASLMLHAGIDLKVIQERLGHADFTTTANIYTHLMQDAQATAAEQLGQMMAEKSPVAVKGGCTKKAQSTND